LKQLRQIRVKNHSVIVSFVVAALSFPFAFMAAMLIAEAFIFSLQRSLPDAFTSSLLFRGVVGLLTIGCCFVLPYLFSRSLYMRMRWRLVDDIASRFCVLCGYDLTGNESGSCPECGHLIRRRLPVEVRGGADSGRIWLDDTYLYYESSTYASWSIRIAHIRVIGESTSWEGPGDDRHFLCFATNADSWFEASFHADGCGTMLKAMENRLGAKLEVSRRSSTELSSRILWPASLCGEPMFDYRPVSPRSIWPDLSYSVTPRLRTVLSDAALNELKR
jgi:hypothetical protein